ncbi:MAG TPA: hypothetical protein VGK73_09480 [Polyangiaceae bacterium]
MNERIRDLTLALGGLIALAALGPSLGACSGSMDATEMGRGTPDSGSGASTASGGRGAGNSAGSFGNAGTTSMGGGAGMPPKPEQELESAFEVPVATDRFVWTANPETGRVALIDAETYEVRLAEAGLRPTTVAAVPNEDGEDTAIVLNADSGDATLLRVNAERELTTLVVSTHLGANAVTVAPSGRYAVAWTNAAAFADGELDTTDGLQDVTVIAFGEEPRSTILSVGYRPSRVAFDRDETRAFIVTEPGLSVVALGEEPRADELVELTDRPVSDQSVRDVSITPDGELAVVRVDGSTELGIVDIAQHERRSIELGDFVTDLDLSRDGTQAFAVVGTELVAVPIPPGNADPGAFPRASVTGALARSVSLSPDSELALLYSNADPSPYLGILTSDDDWESFSGRAVDLKAPVKAVFAAPDARHGVVFQSTAEGSRKAGAFSIVSAEPNRAPKIVGTDAPPFQVAFAPDGADAVIATRDLAAAKYGMYLLHLDNLEENFTALPSPPLAAGMVPAARTAFVAQAHPEGRITFVNLDDGSQRTLTGFELAAKVVE